MKNENQQKEKAPVRKGFIAILVLAIAIFGLYSMLIAFLKYLGLA